MKTNSNKLQPTHHAGSRRCGLGLAFILAMVSTATAQVLLTGTNYTQDFDALGAGLPPGWTVRTNATSTTLGDPANFSATTKSWADSGGAFGNFAALTNNSGVAATGAESSSTQAGFTNRVLGIRQTGSFGDPGAAFVFQAVNTIGLSNLSCQVSFNLLRSNAASTTWRLEYAIGNTPGTFQLLDEYLDPGTIGSFLVSYPLGTDANNQSENLWLRVVALNPSSGGTRDSFGIDNFQLTYVGPSAPQISTGPQSQTNAVLSTAQLSVGASGVPPLYYQWYKDGTPLADVGNFTGVATDTLTISGVFHTNGGNYTVVISNSFDSVTSAPASLTVVGFAIAPIAATNTLGGSPVTVPVAFIDNQSPVTGLGGTSSDVALLPDGNIEGSTLGNSGEIVLTPLPGSAGVVLVQATASDGSFSTNLTFALLTVPAVEVVFNDRFNYEDGPVSDGSAGLWQHHSGAAGELAVNGNELLVSRSFTEDAHALLAGRPHTVAGDAVLYTRFQVRFTTLPSALGNYFAHLMDESNQEQRARIWASTTNAVTGYRLGVGNANSASASSGQFPQDLDLDTNYTVVTRYSVSNGLTTLWINPTSESDPSVTATDVVPDVVDISSVAFRQDGSEGIMRVDDVVVATTFAAAMGTPIQSVLTIHVLGSEAILSWSNSDLVLQSAPTTSGLFTNVPGAVSPHTNVIAESQKYFRLALP